MTKQKLANLVLRGSNLHAPLKKCFGVQPLLVFGKYDKGPVSCLPRSFTSSMEWAIFDVWKRMLMF